MFCSPRDNWIQTLCRDEVQPVFGGQIKRIADQRRTRIERRIHLDLGQQFHSPPGTKNGHAALNVANVEPVAGQQEASPDGPASLVLPDVGAGCGVQTMKRSAEVPNVQQTVLRDGRSHHAADLARSAEESALGDVSLAVGTDRMNKRKSVAVEWILPQGNEDASVGEDW